MGVRTLEEKTQVYWNISQAYNSPKPILTVERAIKDLGSIEDETSSRKSLAKHTTEMLDKIIGVSTSNSQLIAIAGNAPYEAGQDNYEWDEGPKAA